MTTTWLDEAIANFSWPGMAIGPVLIGLICRVGDSRGSAMVRVLTVVVAVLLMSVHAIAFWPVFILWLAMMIASLWLGR
jgi:hypothetical protein